MTDSNLISTAQAMALAYLKTGLAEKFQGEDTLGELWGLGGDYEVTAHIMTDVVPVAEKLVDETNMDDITKLYEFYGDTLPAALIRELPKTQEELETCIKFAIEVTP
ncbi:hypothetical protein [Vibrio parahaemolyticus]|uniref:hypothetical protein n=1 Tax=Vibrio parahaemolyticus TaxID=670 RepID=UPI003D817338